MGFLNHQQSQPSFLGPEIDQFLACLVVHLFAGQGANSDPEENFEMSQFLKHNTKKTKPDFAEGLCLSQAPPGHVVIHDNG